MLIPWERIFAFDDVETHNLAINSCPMWPQYMQQVDGKDIAKLEFILGRARRIVDAISIGGSRTCKRRSREIIDTLGMVRASCARPRPMRARALGRASGRAGAADRHAALVSRRLHPRIWIVEQLARAD